MEHWGVTLLLLYRAIACLAAPLQACSISVTLIMSNFKENHKGSEKKIEKLFFFFKNECSCCLVFQTTIRQEFHSMQGGVSSMHLAAILHRKLSKQPTHLYLTGHNKKRPTCVGYNCLQFTACTIMCQQNTFSNASKCPINVQIFISLRWTHVFLNCVTGHV